MADVTKEVRIKMSAEDAASGVFDKMETRFDQLKATFGRGLFSKEIGDVLVGGGALIGLRALSDAFAKVGASIAEVHKEMQDTNTNAVDIADHLASSLPIIGAIYAGMKD